MTLTNIFVDKELHDIVSLKSSQITPDIYLYLKENLKNNVEKKCLSFCYIIKVREITEYDHGEMRAGDFSGDVNFKITYNAHVCIPVIGTNIVCKINKIIKLLILVQNGPFLCSIRVSENEIDPNVFSIQNGEKIIHKKTKQELGIGSYVKINLINQRIYPGQNFISGLGKLYDIATQEEINKYMFKDIEIDQFVVENNTNIMMNEDDGIDIGIIPIKGNQKESYVQDI